MVQPISFLRAVLPEAPGTGPASAVPGEFVGRARQRLVTVLWISAAVLVLYVLLYGLVWTAEAHPLGRWLSLAMVAISLLLARWLATERSQRQVVACAIAYEVGLCLMTAVIEYWRLPPIELALGTVSFNCITIVLFPYLIPARPWTMVAGALAAASMSPLGLAVGVTVGDGTLPSGPVILSMLLPPYFSAFLALVPARALDELGRDVSRAQRLGSYELIERIGMGGMGEVWRAHHRLLARPAAIKLMRPPAGGVVGSDAEAITRFAREAQAIARLESPHTVQLFDYGVSDDGVLFHVLELLRGLDLGHLVDRFGPQPPERVVWILLQVCDSLDDAHRAGLVHRDIKPSNIFLTRRGRHHDVVKVLDFGLVKDREGLAGSAASTAEHRIAGTPAYLAPELITGDRPVDGRADLYALGCVAYRLLSGQQVFTATSPMQFAIAHARATPPPLADRAPRPIPVALEAVVLRCLAKVPEDRPASAEELADALAAIELEQPWDDARARDWWRRHLPDAFRAGPGRERMDSCDTEAIHERTTRVL